MDNDIRAQAALDLWREWIAKDLHPFEGRGISGDEYCCYFCSEYQHNSPYANDFEPRHAPDCVYIRAKRIVEGE